MQSFFMNCSKAPQKLILGRVVQSNIRGRPIYSLILCPNLFFVEPVLPRLSENIRSSFLGKCKTVGLSKRSKSSLERVREKDSKLKQQKIGFERFSYAKRKRISYVS